MSDRIAPLTVRVDKIERRPGKRNGLIVGEEGDKGRIIVGYTITGFSPRIPNVGDFIRVDNSTHWFQSSTIVKSEVVEDNHIYELTTRNSVYRMTILP